MANEEYSMIERERKDAAGGKRSEIDVPASCVSLRLSWLRGTTCTPTGGEIFLNAI